MRQHTEHERYMSQALRLAAKAQGRTSPNPAVGAVIVRARRIVGEGFHRRAGDAHAEIEALRQAGAAAKSATLYVTLEPCNHTGRTPPCCDAIVRSGISRVVIADKDPNPITDGRGLARLRRAGLNLVYGILQQEARRLNEPFYQVMTSGLPRVIAKSAQSLDGRIATAAGESRWITSPQARRIGHEWRSRVDAVLVGINTVLRDDPRLSVRGVPHRPGRPVRVVIDSHLRMPPTARCLTARPGGRTVLATTEAAMRDPRAAARAHALLMRGAEILALPARQGRVPFRRLCRALARRGIHSLLIEGGGEALAGALDERVVDRLVWFVAPLLIGGRNAVPSVGGGGAIRLARAIRLDELTVRRIGPDLCIEARVVYPNARRRGRHAG
jgi:diaminohydroxyphosphoribosylaminopyrimidine deaminase/5-amino-6-(5-phosphoribosylamino)uracil reductase